MPTKDDSFAHRLKAHREAAGFTLAELAERAGISKTYLWELEKDEAGEKSPSVDVAKKIAAALSVGLLDLVGDDDRAVLREQLIRRACKAMGWEYKTSPVWTGLRKVALAEAVPISLEKLSEMLDRIEAISRPDDFRHVDEMRCPVPCSKCGKFIELNDSKWIRDGMGREQGVCDDCFEEGDDE